MPKKYYPRRRDFLGNLIAIGDLCVYLKNTTTGTSTVRKKLFKGIVTDITGDKTVVFDKFYRTFNPSEIIDITKERNKDPNNKDI